MSVQKRRQQSGEPARQHGTPDPQEEFVHGELPQTQRLGQRDLQTPPPGLSPAPLVPVGEAKGKEVANSQTHKASTVSLKDL